MEPFQTAAIVDDLTEAGDRFEEFLRWDSMSVAIYRLPAGATDDQDPHAEDEIYYVLSGRAKIRIEGDEHPVEPGDVVFVGRGDVHQFVDIEETLETLVVFAPAFRSLEASER